MAVNSYPAASDEFSRSSRAHSLNSLALRIAKINAIGRDAETVGQQKMFRVDLRRGRAFRQHDCVFAALEKLWRGSFGLRQVHDRLPRALQITLISFVFAIEHGELGRELGTVLQPRIKNRIELSLLQALPNFIEEFLRSVRKIIATTFSARRTRQNVARAAEDIVIGRLLLRRDA